MRQLIIFLLLAFVIVGGSGGVSGPAGVVLDSQQIAPSSIDLRGVDPTVFNSSEFKNEPLGDPHYFWDTQVIKQNDSPDDYNLVNWSNAWVELPQSFTRS